MAGRDGSQPGGVYRADNFEHNRVLFAGILPPLRQTALFAEITEATGRQMAPRRQPTESSVGTGKRPEITQFVRSLLISGQWPGCY